MVALFQSLLRQPFPTFRPINSLRRLESDIQVTAFNGKVKPRVLVLDEVQCDLKSVRLVPISNHDIRHNKMVAHLRESFLLQIGYNALAQQSRGADDMKHFLVIVAQKGQFETVFGWIESDRPRTRGAI